MYYRFKYLVLRGWGSFGGVMLRGVIGFGRVKCFIKVRCRVGRFINW